MYKTFTLSVLIFTSYFAYSATWQTLTPVAETMDKVTNVDAAWQQKYPIIKQLSIQDIGIPKSNSPQETNYFKAITNQFNINNDALTFILTNLSDIDVITAAIKYVAYYQQFVFTSNSSNLLPYYKQMRIADSCIVLLKIQNHLHINLIDQQLLAILNSNPDIKNLYLEHYNEVMKSWPSYGYDFWDAKNLCLTKAY